MHNCNTVANVFINKKLTRLKTLILFILENVKSFHSYYRELTYRNYSVEHFKDAQILNTMITSKALSMSVHRWYFIISCNRALQHSDEQTCRQIGPAD